MRKTIIGISCCIVLLLLGFASYRGYQVWKQNHLLSLAKICAERKDYRTEYVWLQQLLSVSPRNLEACRMMAAVNEVTHSSEALVWRQRVLELNPNSLEDRLALALSALTFSDIATATNTLAAVDPADRDTFAYQNLAGVVATTLGRLDEAQNNFKEAIRLEPGDVNPQISLAVIRLNRSNALDMAEARITLKRISLEATNADIRLKATRHLIADAIRSKDFDTALTMTKNLVQATNSTFPDKLILLDILKSAKSPDYPAALAQTKALAVKAQSSLSDMSTWMLSRDGREETQAWLESLPAELQGEQPVAMILAETWMAGGNWSKLQSNLEKQNWGGLEFSRHAFLALALREQSMGGTSSAEWELALKDADVSKGKLILLFRMAAAWNWVDEAEEILWTIVNRYPEERWAGPLLKTALIQGGRTRPLMQLLITMSRRTPDDLELKNDLAMMALLLDDKDIDSLDLAGSVYKASPQNAAFASTYAFALYQKKQNPEALKVMQQLPAAVLNDPQVAGYYGLVLKANGDEAKAKAYLNLALAKAFLLPEERKLFLEAIKN